MTRAPFRLALRAEGQWRKAYIAKPDSMAGAIEVARVRIAAAGADAGVKQAFIRLAQSVVEHTAKSTGLDVADWQEPAPAPEHEKSGHS